MIDAVAQSNAAGQQQPAVPLQTPNVQGTDRIPDAPKGTTIDDLLKSTTPANDPGYVHFGNVRVEQDLANDFSAAQRHLAKSPEAMGALYALENAKEQVTYRKSNDDNDQYSYGSNEHTITWDPKTALLNTNGTAVSPAMGLLHEQGHALEHALHPDRMATNAGENNERYTNAEEQRNITGLETRVAGALGEGTRTDHGGIAYDARGVAQTLPVAAQPLTPAEAVTKLDDHLYVQNSLGYATPPVPTVDQIHPWDQKAHTGSIVHVDADTVAQYAGRNAYVLYDVHRDLHGHVPPENVPGLTIDAKGNVHEPAIQHEHGHARS